MIRARSEIRGKRRNKPTGKSSSRTKKTYRMSSFFAGIGGFDLGFEKVGIHPVFQCEIDKFCQSVLSRHWPDVPCVPDIACVEPSAIPRSEIWA